MHKSCSFSALRKNKWNLPLSPAALLIGKLPVAVHGSGPGRGVEEQPAFAIGSHIWVTALNSSVSIHTRVVGRAPRPVQP